MNASKASSRSARWSRPLRVMAVFAASASSIATFGGDNGWELHDRAEDAAPVVLGASATSWTDAFRVRGTGIGRTDVTFDGAVELTPSNALTTPVRVRIRFVPSTAGVDPEESTIFVTRGVAFTAVTSHLHCDPDQMVTCTLDGDFEVEILDTAALGSDTLSLHWVTTGTVQGRGPAPPADAGVNLTQP